MVLANPANSVIPVIGARAALPYRCTRAANADSYSPAPMPRPMTTHARKSDQGTVAKPRLARPAANTRLATISTGRPPKRSIARPLMGPSNAEAMSATENAPNTVGVETPRSREIGTAKIASR